MSYEEWRAVVQPKIARIMNAFAFSPALELQLQARNLVDANDLEDIKSKPTDYERKSKLIWTYLATRGPGSLEKFCDSLAQVRADSSVVEDVRQALAQYQRSLLPAPRRPSSLRRVTPPVVYSSPIRQAEDDEEDTTEPDTLTSHPGIKPDAVWEKNTEMVVYRGRRFRVCSESGVLSSHFFRLLQDRCSAIAGYRSQRWRHGMYMITASGLHMAECLIELASEETAIDVVVRCARGGKVAAKQILEDVKRMIEAVGREALPVNSLEWCYLDSNDLSKHVIKPAIYEKADVKSCEVNELVTARDPKGGKFPRIKVKDLHLSVAREDVLSSSDFPSPEESVSRRLIIAVASAARSVWEEICCELLGVECMQDIKRGNHSSKVSLTIVLDQWTKKVQEEPTVGKLIRVCENSSVAERFIREKYKKCSVE